MEMMMTHPQMKMAATLPPPMVPSGIGRGGSLKVNPHPLPLWRPSRRIGSGTSNGFVSGTTRLLPHLSALRKTTETLLLVVMRQRLALPLWRIRLSPRMLRK